jgi:hypothetical protein
MPTIPTRFPVELGAVFPDGVFILGVEPSQEFQDDRNAPKRQERDRETNQIVWVVRALDANEEAARLDVAYSFRTAWMWAPTAGKVSRPASTDATKAA